MVEVYVPFLLLLISWNPSDPQASMEVRPRVYLGAQECAAAGAEIAKLRADQPADGRQFVWRCVEMQHDIEIYQPPMDGQ